MATKAAGLLTLMGGGMWFQDEPAPVVYVNKNNDLFAEWPSESLRSDSLPECSFYNQSVTFSSELCSLFVVNRVASLYHRASQRALTCAAAYGGECILSPEIGLGLPAAFLYDHATASIRMLIAPKLVEMSEPVHVRVAPPDGDGITSTRTMVLNNTVQVEYLDGKTKSLVKEELVGSDSFCVQLLRHSFETACWEALDL